MNSSQIKARSLARKAGVIGIINRLRPQGDYEERVNRTLVGAVKPGDVVWDAGANVGVYTDLFCQCVGKDGYVVAFEPFSGSCDEIRQRVPDCEWLQIENVALGDTDTTAILVTGDNSTVNLLATELDAELRGGGIPVVVYRGDTAFKRSARVPNVNKVDVEGFEEEVLSGMEEVLAAPALRSVLVRSIS